MSKALVLAGGLPLQLPALALKENLKSRAVTCVDLDRVPDRVNRDVLVAGLAAGARLVEPADVTPDVTPLPRLWSRLGLVFSAVKSFGAVAWSAGVGWCGIEATLGSLEVMTGRAASSPDLWSLLAPWVDSGWGHTLAGIAAGFWLAQKVADWLQPKGADLRQLAVASTRVLYLPAATQELVLGLRADLDVVCDRLSTREAFPAVEMAYRAQAALAVEAELRKLGGQADVERADRLAADAVSLAAQVAAMAVEASKDEVQRAQEAAEAEVVRKREALAPFTGAEPADDDLSDAPPAWMVEAEQAALAAEVDC